MRALPAFFILLMLSLPASAQVYKWTDAHGKVHYSDKPVGNGQAIRIPKPHQANPEAKTRLQQFRNQLDSSKVIDEKQAEEAQKLASEREARCKQTRDQLKAFEEFGQIVQMKDGERVYLDYQQKDAQMAEMRQFLQENCN